MSKITKPASQKSNLLSLIICATVIIFATAFPGKLFAQKPTLSYPGPETYIVDYPITTPLAPVSTNVAPFAYNPNSIRINLNSSPTSIAVDSLGTIYVAADGNLAKMASDGTGYTIIEPSSSFYTTQVTIDRAGNIYYASTNVIKKIPAGSNTPVVFNTDFTPGAIAGLATDAYGDVYVADRNRYSVIKIRNGISRLIGPSIHGLSHLALDTYGNIFVTATNYNVYWISSFGGSRLIQVEVPTRDNGLPTGIVFDSTGGFYVTYRKAGTSVLYSIRGYQFQKICALKYPADIAIDSKGVLYVADDGENKIRKVVPSGGYYINQRLPVDMSFNSNTGVISGTPTKPRQSTIYKVTAYNAKGGTSANLQIHVLPAALSGLTINNGGTDSPDSRATLTPAFSPIDTVYTTTVPGYCKSIGIKPIIPVSYYDFTFILVNGVKIRLDKTAGTLPLNFGPNVFNVVAESAKSGQTTTYIVTVVRGSQNAKLSNLSVSSGTLSPAFGRNILNYKVSTTAPTITVTPTTYLTDASVTVNGTAVTSGTASLPVTLIAGQNIIPVVVTAPDKSTMQTYNIAVTQPGDANLSALSLSNGTLDPSFTPNGTSYTASVPYYTKTTGVIPVTDNTAATVTVNGVSVTPGKSTGPLPLATGPNTFTVIVTAADGIVNKTYTVVVTKGSLSLSESAAVVSYPNPFKNTINLNLGNKNIRNLTVEIHNIQNGKLIYSKQFTNRAGMLQLDLSHVNLGCGIYALHVSTDGSNKTLKIIKD